MWMRYWNVRFALHTPFTNIRIFTLSVRNGERFSVVLCCTLVIKTTNFTSSFDEVHCCHQEVSHKAITVYPHTHTYNAHIIYLCVVYLYSRQIPFISYLVQRHRTQFSMWISHDTMSPVNGSKAFIYVVHRTARIEAQTSARCSSI